MEHVLVRSLSGLFRKTGRYFVDDSASALFQVSCCEGGASFGFRPLAYCVDLRTCYPFTCYTLLASVSLCILFFLFGGAASICRAVALIWGCDVSNKVHCVVCVCWFWISKKGAGTVRQKGQRPKLPVSPACFKHEYRPYTPPTGPPPPEACDQAYWQVEIGGKSAAPQTDVLNAPNVPPAASQILMGTAPPLACNMS